MNTYQRGFNQSILQHSFASLRLRSGRAFDFAQGGPLTSLRVDLRLRSGRAFDFAQGGPSASLRVDPRLCLGQSSTSFRMTNDRIENQHKL